VDSKYGVVRTVEDYTDHSNPAYTEKDWSEDRPRVVLKVDLTSARPCLREVVFVLGLVKASVVLFKEA